jgi:hypothetical protein
MYADWEGRNKTFLDYMIMFVENHKKLTKFSQELICSFSRFSGCKVNIQKPIGFLYTSNEQIEFDIKNNPTM